MSFIGEIPLGLHVEVNARFICLYNEKAFAWLYLISYFLVPLDDFSFRCYRLGCCNEGTPPYPRLDSRYLPLVIVGDSAGSLTTSCGG